ncbi:NUDIX hydrolase [Ornithinibacillus scapharcae]|uniref:NUDIX hydrolase n=1 Tax=Ornithinibacillus scapharcae TaxID=1147159 RepID=UPI000225C042|nr:NUDIX hydrolase [Ornithinibacillus scapharcae]
MSHKLAAGIIVLDGDQILLVKDDKGWGLPKGGTEQGETFKQSAMREGVEETGYEIEAKEVAFVTEFTSKKHGSYLQVYYTGDIIGQTHQELDQEIVAVEFIPIQRLREYITFHPWILSLERWLEKRELGYHFYDLDEIGYRI